MDNWREATPDDVKNDAELLKRLEGVQDLPNLIKGYVHGQRRMDAAVTVPKADASPEELDKFYNTMGRPPTLDGYQITRPVVSEGMTYDEDLEKWFLGEAHKAGLTQRQVQAFVEKFSARNTETFQKMGETTKEAEAKFKTELGTKYNETVKAAQDVVMKLGDEALDAYLDATGIGNNIPLVKMLAKIAPLIAEQKIVIGDEVPVRMTTEEIDTKIHNIRTDPKHAFNDAMASRDARAAAVAEMRDLYNQKAQLTEAK